MKEIIHRVKNITSRRSRKRYDWQHVLDVINFIYIFIFHFVFFLSVSVYEFVKLSLLSHLVAQRQQSHCRTIERMCSFFFFSVMKNNELKSLNIHRHIPEHNFVLKLHKQYLIY